MNQRTVFVPQETQSACPHLPIHLWAAVVGRALAAAAADGCIAALKTAAALLAVSHDVAAAVQEVPLRLDFRAASEDELALLLPLAATLPLHTLQLGAQHASGEALLRSKAVGERSGGSLRALAATVACTGTLARFPGLQELHLHAGAVERLYPTVLHGLPSLKHLGLHGYRELALEQLPPAVAATLRVLEVTPRPEALWCRLDLRLPPGACLQQVTVHGSFERILSAHAAPQVVIDTPALVRRCAEVRIETTLAIWRLEGSYCASAGPVPALIGMLLHPDAGWHRIELSLLGGVCLEVPPDQLHEPQPAGAPPLRILVHLDQFVEEFNCRAHGCAHASLRRSTCSIFHPRVLRLERQAQL